jgi:hypothetical protein
LADLYGNTTDLSKILTAVNDVKSEVDVQTDLIAQIASALEGKTLPDSGESGSDNSYPSWIDINTLETKTSGEYTIYYLPCDYDIFKVALIRHIESGSFKKLDYLVKTGTDITISESMFTGADGGFDLYYETDVIKNRTVEYMII